MSQEHDSFDAPKDQHSRQKTVFHFGSGLQDFNPAVTDWPVATELDLTAFPHTEAACQVGRAGPPTNGMGLGQTRDMGGIGVVKRISSPHATAVHLEVKLCKVLPPPGQ